MFRVKVALAAKQTVSLQISDGDVIPGSLKNDRKEFEMRFFHPKLYSFQEVYYI